MTLKYQLKFYDYWHISSGLSAGARLDSTVIKDDDGLPYVAGKIIKGLSREMAELLGDNLFIATCFGTEGSYMGKCYFANAIVPSHSARQIKEHHLQDNLYDIIASTAVDEKTSMAQDNSLREIEVVVPLVLDGEIRDIPEQYKEEMSTTLKMIKRMGLNRNRGLGRCEFIVEASK